MRSYPTYASVFAELEIEVEGTWYPGQRDRDDEPGHGPYAEAEEVTGLFLPPRGVSPRVDLLKGIDKDSPAYRVLLGNLLSALGDEADEALSLTEPE